MILVDGSVAPEIPRIFFRIDLEPETTNIWDRGLSLLGPNTFGYAYETGKDQATHLAVVHVTSD